MLVRAMELAERYLPRDQALEVAHEVASELLRLSADRVTGTLLYIAVTNRLRRHARAARRRSAAESAYGEKWSSAIPAWVEPGAEMEIRELQLRIERVLAEMPPGMREIFSLIREEGLSYKEAAARVGVRVSTVHTQLSRASALLRQCVADYQADARPDQQSLKGRFS
jgi:RNA polymerase sigma factor (sigma-70 family)